MIVGATIKMSKSKKNVVDPEDILSSYGADATRLFVLSDSPPDRDLEWTESGIDGAWKYVNRLYRIYDENLPIVKDISSDKPSSFSDNATELRRKTHQTALLMGRDIEDFHMNKAVARLRELSNMIETYKADSQDEKWALCEALEYMAICMNPILPHLAEELWCIMGHKGLLVETPWPKVDEGLLQTNVVTLAVQVNGKVKSTITISRDAAESEAKETALADENVIKALDNKEIRKFIYVPNRIVNMVVG